MPGCVNLIEKLGLKFYFIFNSLSLFFPSPPSVVCAHICWRMCSCAQTYRQEEVVRCPVHHSFLYSLERRTLTQSRGRLVSNKYHQFLSSFSPFPCQHWVCRCTSNRSWLIFLWGLNSGPNVCPYTVHANLTFFFVPWSY